MMKLKETDNSYRERLQSVSLDMKDRLVKGDELDRVGRPIALRREFLYTEDLNYKMSIYTPRERTLTLFWQASSIEYSKTYKFYYPEKTTKFNDLAWKALVDLFNLGFVPKDDFSLNSAYTALVYKIYA